MNLIKKAQELTPVQEINGVWFKRDDLFRPFEDDGTTTSQMCGGKVRQAIHLIHNNENLIKNEYQNTICTASSVKSPQLVILAKIAQKYNMKFLGGIVTTKTVEECAKLNPMVQMSLDLGADIKVLSKISYNNVLYSKLNNYQGFKVSFGINLENDFDAIIGSIANQVQNIPDNLDNLIVPVGSGVTFAGILIGLEKFNKKTNVIGIQIAGYDRSKTIYNTLPFEYKDIKYNFIPDKTYPYSKKLHKTITKTDIELSPIYESKAYEYAQNMNLLNCKTKDLFWIIGNENTLFV